MRDKLVNVNDCIPMPELVRDYYPPAKYQYLKKVIQRDSFARHYPVRAIWNKKKKRYEVFDGIHRLKVAQDLEIKKIPLVDETSRLTRQMAIAEGIKANATHASYNPIDIAKHLNALAESHSRTERYTFGRPIKHDLKYLAEEMGMSEMNILRYLKLLKLPKDVQRLVGEGNLHLTHALILLKLDGNPHSFMIPELAQSVVKEGMSRNKLLGIVESILKKGFYEDTALCVGCKRPFPKESISRPNLCPECINVLRSGKLSRPVREKRNEAMQKYLRFNHHAKRLREQGKQIPEPLQNYLERLYEEWQGKKLELISD